MFEKLKTYMLERQIRDTLERYYWEFGLTLEEAKRLPMQQLLERLKDFLADNKREVNYYASVVGHYVEQVQTLTVSNEEMKLRMRDMKGENKGLHSELAKLREDNYRLKLENTLYKQQGYVMDKEQEKDLTKQNSQGNVTELSAAR
jgi:hypothetical protein